MTIEDIAVRLQATDARACSNTKRLDKIEQRQDNLDQLVQSVSVMANEQEHMKNDIGEVKADVKTLIDKPGKRWDNIVEKIILVFVAGMVTYLLTKAGLR